MYHLVNQMRQISSGTKKSTCSSIKDVANGDKAGGGGWVRGGSLDAKGGPKLNVHFLAFQVWWHEMKIYELALIMSESNSAELANLTLMAPSSRGILA